MKVDNPYIAAMYELKKEEYRSHNREYKSRQRIYPDLQELELFHCTSKDAVDDIVENNLDWRFVRRARYGVGNCFSGDADYANCHANRGIGKFESLNISKDDNHW